MNKILLFLAVLCLPAIAFSQTTGDYRTHQSGPWSTLATWERWNGTTWITPAPAAPSAADNLIDILSTHVVTVTSTVSIDQTTIQAGGQVTVNAGVSFTVANPTGTTAAAPELLIAGTLNVLSTGTFAVNVGTLANRCFVNISGTINNAGNFTLGANSRIAFLAGSLYNLQHTTDAGTIPQGASAAVVTWSTSSTCQISGYTFNATAPTGLNQAFGNFVWDTPNLNAGGLFDLNGQLTSVAGNFTINSVGTNDDLLMLSNTTAYTLNILNNFIINSGSTVFAGDAPASAVINVTNGVFINGGSNFATANTADVTINTGGSFYILGGDFDFSPTDPAATVIVNAVGDVAFNSPGIASNAGAATINFTGTTQNFFSSNFSTGTINFHVASTSTLNLVGTSAGSGTLLVDGILQLTSNAAAGALQAGAAGGNVQLTGTRTYTSGSTIIYGIGTVAIGNGHPATAGVNTTVTGSGVTLANNVTIGGTLTLVGGNITVSNRTLTLNGNFVPNGNSLVTSTTSSLAIGGSGAFGVLNLSGSTTITNFTINRISTGSVTLGTDLTISGTFNETAGDLQLNGHVLTIQGPWNYTAGTLVVTATSSIVVEGTGAATATLSISGSALNMLTINRTGTTVTCGNTFTLTSLNLWAGTFNNSGTITMAAGGAIVSRDGGFLSSPLGAATTFDVTYLNTTGSPQNTGPELPSSTSLLRNLTVNSANPINLSQAVTVNGDLTFSNGIFNAGSNAIDLKGNLISNNTSQLTSSAMTFSGTTIVSGTTPVIFGGVTVTGSLTPNTNFNINGNLVNNGTLNSGSATVTFGGATTISGTSPSSFNNVIIAASSSLTAPTNFNVAGNWTNNGTFNRGAATNTVTFNGTTTIGGTATTPASDFSGIIIAASSTVTAPAALAVAGVFTDNGTFTAGASGTVTFNGAVVQNINGSSATVFRNISSANPSSIVFQTNKSITGALTILPGAGTGVINANGRLTLISNAAGDAYIAPITNGSITGNVIAQRYLPNTTGAKVYRYLASPVTNAVVSDWKADFPITGTFSDPSTAAEWPGVTPFTQAGKSLFFYNEAHTPTTTVGDRYESYPLNGVASTASPIVNGLGYTAYIRFTTARTIDVTGAPAQGNVNVNVTNQSGSIGGNDGWNLIGNPYAAPINWDNVTLPGGLSGTIAMKDNADNIGLGAGQYVYYSHGSPGTGIPGTYTGTLASGQAFNVRAITNSTINFTESAKQATTTPIFIRSASESDIARVHISGNGKHDEMVIDFTATGNDAADQNDGFKLSNDFVNLYSLSSDGTKMAINGMGPINCFKEVKLGVDNVQAGKYTLSFGQLETFDSGLEIRLVDAFTNTSKVIVSNATIYEFDVTSDVKSYGISRFKLTFSTTGLPTSLAFVKSNVCAGSDASIGLDSSTAGLSYYLTLNGNQVGQAINGNGGPISFAIGKDKLNVGVNRFTMTAAATTCQAGYSQKDSIIVEQIYQATASSTTSCQAGPVTITAEGAPASGHYNWYAGKDDINAIAGQTGKTYTTPTLNKTATYYVAAVNAAGCEGDRIAVVAPVINYENATITMIDVSTLQSNYTHGNHWKLDGVTLSDTTATLVATASGTYTLEVKIGTCTTSAEQIFVVTGVETTVNGITGYPNPVSVEQNIYTVEIKDPSNIVPVKLPVFNALGVQVGSMNLTSQGAMKKGQYDFGTHAAGMYLVRIASGNSVSVLKIIKK